MPTIPEYTRGIIKPRETPQLSDPNAVREAAAPAAGIAEFTNQIAQSEMKKNNRFDTIQRARTVQQFNQEMQTEFAKFSQEADLTDPESVATFNKKVRDKAFQYIKTHNGGQESKASLETQLISLQDSYTTRMSETARNTQKAFIMDTAGKEINRISSQVRQNPEYLTTAFEELNGVMGEYGAAMETIDELTVMETARGQLVQSALESRLDRGDYDDAREIIDSNPQLLNYMTADQQRSVVSRIQVGLQTQEQERTKVFREINTLKSAAKELGVEVPDASIYSAVTGISMQDSVEGKLNKFAELTNTPRDQLSPSVVAKLGFGVDLPSAGEIDMNKERTPDGGYTPKGIGAQIKPQFDTAANTKIMVDKVILQADAFLTDGNKQSGLAAMIAFNKLIDDGAVVREGDLRISAQGNSAFDNLKLAYDKIEKGGIATPKQIEEMKASAKIFQKSVLEAAKTQIDPFLTEAKGKGYRMIDIGLPQDSYDRVFNGVKSSGDVKGEKQKRIVDAAKQRGMTPDQLFEAMAKEKGLTVDEIKKNLGYGG
jgi:hypothetical protein